jgi:hypothetical protein
MPTTKVISSTSGAQEELQVIEVKADIQTTLEFPTGEIKVEVKKSRVRAPKKDKFYISKELKKVLTSLIALDNETVTTICNKILNRKFVEKDGFNYLGLSKDGKNVSFLDKTRVEKYKDEESEKFYFKLGSVVEFKYEHERRSYWGVQTAEFDDPVTVTLTKTKSNFTPRSNSSQKIDKLQVQFKSPEVVPDTNGFYNVEDLIFISETETESFFNADLILHKGRVDSYSWNSLKLHITSEGNFTTFPNCYRNGRTSNFKLKVIPEKIKKVWDYKIRYESSPSKLVRKMFEGELTDKELATFSDAFKEITLVGIPGYTYREEKGETIRKNYLGNNYLSGGHGLNSSCMRYDRCQSFFDIYVNNPIVSLATLYFKDKVASRALLWKVGETIYHDRIYSATSESDNIMKGILRKYLNAYNGNLGEIRIPVDPELIESLTRAPYMDSFHTYSVRGGFLTNTSSPGSYPHRYYMRNQHGNIDKYNTIECPCCSRMINQDQFEEYYVWDSSRGLVRSGEDICNNCFIGIYHNGDSYNIKREDLYNPYYGGLTISGAEVTLFSGETAHPDYSSLAQYENGYGYFILDEHPWEEKEFGTYYHPKDPESPSNQKIIEEQAKVAELELSKIDEVSLPVFEEEED